MASLSEVDRALRGVVDRLHAVDEAVRGRHADRTVSCVVADLEVVYTARWQDGSVCDVVREPVGVQGQPASVRLEVGSDDLVALVEGRLNPAAAWAAGRLRVDAGVMDLLRLRTLL